MEVLESTVVTDGKKNRLNMLTEEDWEVKLFLNLLLFLDLKAFIWGPCAQRDVGCPYRPFLR